MPTMIRMRILRTGICIPPMRDGAAAQTNMDDQPDTPAYLMPKPVQMPDSWVPCGEALYAEQAQAEITGDHPLTGRAFQTLARSKTNDDVVLRDANSGDLILVHLTWKPVTRPPQPSFAFVEDLFDLPNGSSGDD